jgi:TetR/AcrR family transcriptional regulator
MALIPGGRRLQILQTLAEMLQDPKVHKITTAGLAERLDVSEAALYRHFASKAQMFEGLIEFIESSVFSVINKITEEETSGLRQAELIVGMLLGFAQRNRGLTRVLIGDALVGEDQRLQVRVNQLLDRVEAALKQALRIGASNGELEQGTEAAAAASLMLCYAIGRWQQFVKSGFTRDPVSQWTGQWSLVTSACVRSRTPSSPCDYR